ncbi:MAG: hypothetical protein COB02_14880 [Candidatus Cloacimonadota bacterium]|nr:MAG: hypothetical protein COB02_14880 [Candidatus Cloacimonadota bacterium]
MRLFSFLMLIFTSYSCDLNHDWRLYDTKLIRDIDARTVLNNLTLRVDKNKKYMVLEVRDLYKKKGKEKQFFLDDYYQKFNNGSKKRSKIEVQALQDKMMKTGSKQILYLSLDEQIKNKNRLYDQDFLNELKEKHQIDAFISVKLRNYAIISKKYRDNYEYNKFVFKNSKEHILEMTYAILNSKGRYLEFKDWKNIITLENVFEKEDNKKKLKIVDKLFNANEAGYIVKEYFLGLESIETFGQTMVGLLEL